MASKNPTKAQLSAKLVEINQLSQNGGTAYTSEKFHGPLIAEGLVEINAGMKNEAGEIATRLTAAGLEAVNAAPASAPAADPNAPKPQFKLEKAALPPISGRGRSAGSEMYPFDQMEVGDSFFVAATAAKPNPAKSLASTVSTATRRYAEVIPGEFKTVKVKGENGAADTTKQVPATKETRKFVVRSRTAAAEKAENFDHGQDGARVYRVA